MNGFAGNAAPKPATMLGSRLLRESDAGNGNKEVVEPIKLEKSNIILLGPTGSGLFSLFYPPSNTYPPPWQSLTFQVPASLTGASSAPTTQETFSALNAARAHPE